MESDQQLLVDLFRHVPTRWLAFACRYASPEWRVALQSPLAIERVWRPRCRALRVPDDADIALRQCVLACRAALQRWSVEYALRSWRRDYAQLSHAMVCYWADEADRADSAGAVDAEQMYELARTAHDDACARVVDDNADAATERMIEERKREAADLLDCLRAVVPPTARFDEDLNDDVARCRFEADPIALYCVEVCGPDGDPYGHGHVRGQALNDVDASWHVTPPVRAFGPPNLIETRGDDDVAVVYRLRSFGDTR